MAHEHTLVVDVGSSSTKFGYSGEDVPSWVIPTAVDHSKFARGNESVENVTFNPHKEDDEKATEGSTGVLMHRGLVHDWDEMQKFWQVITSEIGLNTVQIEKTPVLLIDSPLATIADRTKWAEILFEGYHVPSLCIGNSASLSIFAAGRTSGMVVDVGAGIMTCVPVFEGLALSHACVEMDCAGMDVTNKLKKSLMEQGHNLSLHDTKILKERFAYVNPVAPAAPVPTLKRRASTAKTTATSSGETMTINLPDGNEVNVEKTVFGDCTETLMVNKETLYGGLSKSVYEALILCDDSVLGELKSNIIISGGTSMLSGFGDRLTNDLNALFTSRHIGNASESETAMGVTEAPIRVMPSSFYKESGYTNQRKHAAWQGGSIFASFDTFKQLRVTRQEFEEGAESSLLAKCF